MYIIFIFLVVGNLTQSDFFSSIHFPAIIMMMYFSKTAEQYYIVLMSHIFFFHSSVEGHQGYFYFLDIIIRASMKHG